MKAVRSRLFQRRSVEILRTFQTANQKQVEVAAAVLDDAQAKAEWDMAKPYSAIPGPKSPPFVGHIWRLLTMFTDWGRDMAQMQIDLYKKYGPIIKVSMGKQGMVMLYDPVDVEKMFRNESTWPERMSQYSLKYYRTVLRKEFYEDIEGLATSQGETWQKFRTATNQTMMQPKNVIMYLNAVEAVIDDFIERIRYIRQPNQEMPDDFMNELSKLALESFGVVSLDVRLGCFDKDLSPDSDAMKMINNVKVALTLIQKLEFDAFAWRYISTPSWRELVKRLDEILEITVKHAYAKWDMIKQQGLNEDNPNKSILESLLLKTKNPKIPIVMASDTLFGGIDTTSSTTATFLYHLAINPEKQEKLFEELKTLFPTKTTKITKEIFNELKYTRAVIKESLRLKPTAGGNQRVTKKDLVLGGYQIPSGTSLIAVHQVMCLMDTHFRNAKEFIPERWIRTESEWSKDRNPFVYLPFGFGRRSCIGKRFAELQMEMALAKIIRNFQVSYHHEPMTWTTRLVSAPNKPLRFKMTERPE